MARFSAEFRAGLSDLMRWRRDVRRVRPDPVDEALLTQCLDTVALAPSVGLSEPWRFVRLGSSAARAAALANFESANAEALAGYAGEKAALYSRLKLSGMRDAPVQLAVFCDEATPKGAGLGAATMPEMRRYSVVAAITQFWLAARAGGWGSAGYRSLTPRNSCATLTCPPTGRSWPISASAGPKPGAMCPSWNGPDGKTGTPMSRWR